MPRLTPRAIAAAVFAACLSVALAGCDFFGPRDPLERMRDKITNGYAPGGRNTQTEAMEQMAALCERRAFSETECACMRDAMLDVGTREMAYVGANYGGDFVAAAEISEKMEPGARSRAIAAYLDAERICLAPALPEPEPDQPGLVAVAAAAVTMADIRASCRPAMAEVCACRAEALSGMVGEGAMAAALAINRNDRAGLARAAEGRAEGWAEAVADAYARTSAPCIVQASRR